LQFVISINVFDKLYSRQLDQFTPSLTNTTIGTL